MEKKIYVYENWTDDAPNIIGTLYVKSQRGKETFAFEYDSKFLRRKEVFSLDPDLNFFDGRQYPLNKNYFGIFSDSAPDRWGRVLMDRRETIKAKEEDRKPRKLMESDYLLGVYDLSRMGALRFSLDNEKFLSNDDSMSAPPMTSLRTLEEASRNFENDEFNLSNKWIKQLIGPGSSLGGARPKATVKDVDNALWIAKFPSKNDTHNSAGWEKVVHDLARKCGLDVPESRLENFSKLGSTFLVKRFDREGDKRVHFTSAMTLLSKVDGASAEDGSSYLDIVSFIKAEGASPKNDLLELWKRIVFSMAVTNTDDHLRNHGFLLSENGWRLSPLYDVNPDPTGEYLSLNVTDSDNRVDMKLALETAHYYQIDEMSAKKIANEIIDIVKENWGKIAEKYEISRGEREYMSSAFGNLDTNL